MNHLPRDPEKRLIFAQTICGQGSVYSQPHLEARRDLLLSNMRANWSSFEVTCGEGSYYRLVSVYDWAIWRLKSDEPFDPGTLEVIQAHMALPRYTGSMADDKVDFATPKEKFHAALEAWEKPTIHPAQKDA